MKSAVVASINFVSHFVSSFSFSLLSQGHLVAACRNKSHRNCPVHCYRLLTPDTAAHDTDIVQPDIRESPKLCCLANRHNNQHKFPSNTGIAKASNCEIWSSQGSRGSFYCGLDMTSFVGGFVFRIPDYTVSQPRKNKHVLSTIVQMLDVITSVNVNCYSPMMD
jgi:hypothetical protein